MLDFGCGSGRTIQFTGRQVKAIYGCDVDSEAIAWMQQAYDRSKFLTNKYDPPLPFERGFFDLVYSISIFTHLPERKQWQWLREIRRVLRPGAAALLSVHGEHAYRLFRSGSMNVSANLLSRLTAHKPLSTEPFIYEQYDHFAPGAGEFSGMDDSYGLTFHSEAYLKERWGELFEIVGILPASVDNLQDLVVVQAS